MAFSLNPAQPDDVVEVGVPVSSLGSSWIQVPILDAESSKTLNTPTIEQDSFDLLQGTTSASTSMQPTILKPQASTPTIISHEDVWGNIGQSPSNQISFVHSNSNFGDIFNEINFDDDFMSVEGPEWLDELIHSEKTFNDVEQVLKEEPNQNESIPLQVDFQQPKVPHQQLFEIRIPIPETVLSLDQERTDRNSGMREEHVDTLEISHERKSSDERRVVFAADQSNIIEQQPTVLQVLNTQFGQQGKARGRGRPPKEGVRKITPKVDKRRFVTDDESTCSASEGYLTEDEVERMKKRRARDLNNEASKRCRENRKLLFKKQLEELETLTKRNQDLKRTLNDLHNQVSTLKESMMDTIFKGRIQNLPPKNEAWCQQFDSVEMLAAQAAPCAGMCFDLIPMLQQLKDEENMQYY